ncbi:PHB depolymerase family esterase [Sulfitobacter sp. F26169L]|uniref:extracellular catalytic domain type 1 short-chain-length polyhydroxyalkanoate depolymerase n=1 Tax=Sulfitobacter sp. F26169L TaxID=2996015 RepID=UPI002260BC89|nr:PHB depolymerase family esterase [Sulfitobacter sp. F26169L]MCX7568186.1 PHB depolymerase family esterase [Sulfitobacter sp. F26169L]
MKLFNVGALRQATDDSRLLAANELVQRTLAQHGLVPPSGKAGGMQEFNMPSLDGMLAKFSGKLGKGAELPEAVPEGAKFLNDTFKCEAGSRSFRTYVPASATGGVTGVVVMLHGCTQTPEDFAAGTGMNELAEQHSFVVIYPAQSRGDNAQSCWNWFSRGDQRRGKGEPAILAAMTEQVCNEYGVSRDQTFVAGLSAGAAMAVILGETYGDVFAAVGAHSGLPAGAAKDVPSAFAAMAGNALDAAPLQQSGGTVRTIVFHGTSDATVHPSNGDAIARRAKDAGVSQSIETTTQGTTAGRSFTRALSSDLNGAQIVEHWTIDGQGHAWSGGKSGGSYTDPNGPDASAEMVRFFFNTVGKEL